METLPEVIAYLTKETESRRLSWSYLGIANTYTGEIGGLKFNLTFIEDPKELCVYDLTQDGPVRGVVLSNGQEAIGRGKFLGAFTTHDLPELEGLWEIVSRQEAERRVTLSQVDDIINDSELAAAQKQTTAEQNGRTIAETLTRRTSSRS